MPSVSTQPQQLTRVNGIGLWNSWTRNFKTPLLALLDLLDNSVDAALREAQSEQEAIALGCSVAGTAVRFSDFSHSPSQARKPARPFKGKIHVDYDTWDQRTTGLKITNNSSNVVKDLGEIMEVYSSSKGRVEHGADHSQDDEERSQVFADTIGENGVGLKQGCATLSDLSFVLTRANNGKMGMAVIAQSLQSAAGVYLPHVYFDSTELQLLRNEMQKTFSSQFYSGFGECVAQYGDGSLEDGIKRLLKHFDQLNQKGLREWGEESNVFRVVLHQLKHGQIIDSVTEDYAHTCRNPALEQQHTDNANALVKELQDELPRNYIHIDMEVRVGGEDIKFFYWQRRLAELTEFNINIDEINLYNDMTPDEWKDEKGGYPLRIFCGFDSVRLGTNKGVGGSCSLSIYSRFSGRLIKHEEDARALLKLTAGGTDYSQGLTIIVDDMLGNLPLNPTKQDVAFGEQAHGDVHKRNIFAWLGAVARLYYKYKLEKISNGMKTDLSRKVIAVSKSLQVDLARLKPLNQAKFDSFDKVAWKNSRGTILCSNRKTVELFHGEDTLWKMTKTTPSSKPAKKRKKVTRRHSETDEEDTLPSKKRKKVSRRHSETDEEDTLPLSTLHKRWRAEVNYNEDAAFGLDEDSDVFDEDLPFIDLTAKDNTLKTEAQEVTPNSHQASPSQEQKSSGKDESSACEQLRTLQAQNKQLQEQIETLQARERLLQDSEKRHKEKSHERKKLVRKFHHANEELKNKNEEIRNTVKALEEKIAALTTENTKLRREKSLSREENESLTVKLEEVTNQLLEAEDRE